jgi:hypothetical protein
MGFKENLKTFIAKSLEQTDGLLHHAGLTLRRVRYREIEPARLVEGRSLIYRSSIDSVVTELPLDLARVSYQPLRYDKYGHVNLFALRQALQVPHEKREETVAEILADYSRFNASRNLTAADMLGVDRDEIPNIQDLPPWAVVMPWSDTEDPEARKETINFSTYVENKKRGGPPLNAENGGAQNPLVSEARARFEARLLVHLLSSIEKKGYRPSPNYFDAIGSVLFIKNEREWCWGVSGGIHRCCVLHALGHKTVKSRIKGAVYRQDVQSWPNVVRGFYSKETALKIFDRLLEGRVRESHSRWIDENFSGNS